MGPHTKDHRHILVLKLKEEVHGGKLTQVEVLRQVVVSWADLAVLPDKLLELVWGLMQVVILEKEVARQDSPPALYMDQDINRRK